MRITSFTTGTEELDPFNESLIDLCNYFPLYSNYYLSRTEIDDNGENLQFFTKPDFNKSIFIRNTIRNIEKGLSDTIRPYKITINSKVFYFIKGAIFDDKEMPLLMVTTKTKGQVSERDSDFSYNDLVIFYSTSFFTDPSLSALNRRLQKDILLSCYSKGIEVRLVTSSEIERNTFTRLFEVQKTSSLNQLEIYMNKVLPTYLYTEEEDPFVEELVENNILYVQNPINVQNVQNVSTELSLEEEALLFDDGTYVEQPVYAQATRQQARAIIEEYISHNQSAHTEESPALPPDLSVIERGNVWELIND